MRREYTCDKIFRRGPELLRRSANEQIQDERHLLLQSNLWLNSSWVTNTAAPTYHGSPVHDEAAIKRKAQSATNRASGRFQECVGGRSAPLGPLLPHIIIATRQAPNQEQVLVTSVRKKHSSRCRLILFWLSFFFSLNFLLAQRPQLRITIWADLLSYNPWVSKIAWGEKPLVMKLPAAVMYSSGHLCII